MTKNIILTSPRGKAIFPHLTEADTKFKPEGEYHVKLECKKSESEKLILAIKNEIAKEVKAQNDVTPNKEIKKTSPGYEVDGEKVVFNFKMKASGTRKSDGKHFIQKPNLYGADLSPLGPDVQIWGDSILRITFEPFAWNMPIGIGCTLRIKSVQVIKLVTGAGASNNLGDQKVEPVVTPEVKQEVSI